MTPPRILITRAAPDCPPLAAALEALGFVAVPVPLLLYEFPELPPEVPQRGWLIVTSPRAASRLPAGGQPPGLQVAVIGRATRAAAEARGFRAGLVGTGSGLELGRILAGKSGPWTWWCGDRALPGVEAGLAEVGSKVRREVVYRTVLLDPGEEVWTKCCDGVAAAVFASPSAVEAFEASAPPPFAARVKTTLPAVAAGFATERELRSRGFRRVVRAEDPSPAGLASAVARHLRA